MEQRQETQGRASILRADARHLPLPDASVDLVVTSPPYFSLRSYTDGGEHYAGQIGAEPTPREYIAALLDCTREWARVLKPSGSIFVNLGDKYSQRVALRRSSHQDGLFPNRPELAKDWKRDRAAGLARMPYENVIDNAGRFVPEKSLLMLPERYRVGAVDELGLIARAVVVWSKANGMPESVTDRVRRSHEDWVHLAKQPRYFSAVDDIREEHASRLTPPNLQPLSARTGPEHVPGNTPRKTRAGSNPLGKLPGSVWEIATQPLRVPDHVSHARCCGGQKRDGCADGIGHYAAFPVEWPRRLILGWSPSGICVACGEGRRPITEATRTIDGRPAPGLGGWKRGGVQGETTGMGNWRYGTGRVLLGEVCACPDASAPTRPAVVLDPFSGTGTTVLVASVLGRHGIGVDRSADYCGLARWRVEDPKHRAKALGPPRRRGVPAREVA